MEAQPNLEPIPGYRLIERLGHGGFGEVWKAEAPGGLHKAVKFVYGKLTASRPLGQADRLTHIEQELRGLSRMRQIRHPYILNTERIDIVEGRLIIVMELADRDLGGVFSKYQAAGQPGIPRDELLGYLAEAAEALDFMNSEHDLQHLDIKPENLFLIHTHVKVADFGMAKDLEGVSATVTGGLTPIYAAPEIFSGYASRHSDQYSLAIVYQELLTGRRPFAGPGTAQFMLQHLHREPNVQPLPEADRPVVQRALRKRPDDRYATCTEFIQALREEKRPATAPSPPPAPALPKEEAPAASPRQTVAPVAPVAPGETVLGIDLGTTNSVVAVLEGRTVKVIPNQEGSHLTPSVVAFTPTGERLVGSAALRQIAANPKRTVTSVKRLMGRRTGEVDAARLTYDLAGQADELVRVRIDAHEFVPPEISAMVLRKLREAAEDYLGHEAPKAVITVPAYFNDSQRQATKDAGTIAGLEVLRLLNEPTAASLAYGFDEKTDKKIAVFDLGGGTFDISILHLRHGIFDVLATNGDTYLGGDDFDERIVQFLADRFAGEHGFDPRSDPMATQRLREAAVRAKEELSSRTQVEIDLPFVAVDATGPKHLQATLSRARFEHMTGHLFDRCIEPCRKAMADAGLEASEIEEVVLVGGSTRMPRIRELVHDVFLQVPRQGVNPDEAVAVGAAIQGGMLAGSFQDLLLLDVTPLSLGLEARGGIMSRLIDRNTTIPTVVRKIFTTARDGQAEVGVHVLQGERELASENRTLARFWLEGIRPAPAHTPQIEITFSIDANGILDVAAKDLETGRRQSIQVETSSGLSPADIERMVREAQAFAARDRDHRELQDARNAAESALFEADRMVREIERVLTAEERSVLDQTKAKLRQILGAKDPARIVTAIWEFRQVLGARQFDARQRLPAPPAARRRR